MNTKEIKKVRKATKNSFIIYLRDKPRFLPYWLWRICALMIFTNDGLKLIGAIYGMERTITIKGVRYKIKK